MSFQFYLIMKIYDFTRIKLTLWFQKRDTAGKKMTQLENGLNIGDRASGLGINIKGMDIFLAALKNLEIIQF